MSIEAINWVFNHAPQFADEDPRQRPHLILVLIGLANHADPYGRNAFPAISTLVGYTRLSESTVRRCLQRLLDHGVIREGNPEIQAVLIRRRDRRPTVYDLVMTTGTRDSGQDDPDTPPPPNPGRSRRSDRHGRDRHGRADGVSYEPPRYHSTSDGVSYQPPRGVIPGESGPGMTPEPSLNHPVNHPGRDTRGPARRTVIGPGAGTRAELPPPCGQCDARPGDLIAARVLWLDDNLTQPCPRCHPAASRAASRASSRAGDAVSDARKDAR